MCEHRNGMLTIKKKVSSERLIKNGEVCTDCGDEPDGGERIRFECHDCGESFNYDPNKKSLPQWIREYMR